MTSLLFLNFHRNGKYVFLDFFFGFHDALIFNRQWFFGKSKK